MKNFISPPHPLYGSIFIPALLRYLFYFSSPFSYFLIHSFAWIGREDNVFQSMLIIFATIFICFNSFEFSKYLSTDSSSLRYFYFICFLFISLIWPFYFPGIIAVYVLLFLPISFLFNSYDSFSGSFFSNHLPSRKDIHTFPN